MYDTTPIFESVPIKRRILAAYHSISQSSNPYTISSLQIPISHVLTELPARYHHCKKEAAESPVLLVIHADRHSVFRVVRIIVAVLRLFNLVMGQCP